MTLRLGWYLAAAVPVAAIAAEKAMRSLEPSEARFWWALVAVQLLSFGGYAASSLPQWAGWIDQDGGPVAILERRLKIIQGLIIAILAGNIAYFGGYHYFLLAEVICFGSASVAAYGGDKFLSPLLSRLTGRVQEG